MPPFQKRCFDLLLITLIPLFVVFRVINRLTFEVKWSWFDTLLLALIFVIVGWLMAFTPYPVPFIKSRTPQPLGAQNE